MLKKQPKKYKYNKIHKAKITSNKGLQKPLLEAYPLGWKIQKLNPLKKYLIWRQYEVVRQLVTRRIRLKKRVKNKKHHAYIRFQEYLRSRRRRFKLFSTIRVQRKIRRRPFRKIKRKRIHRLRRIRARKLVSTRGVVRSKKSKHRRGSINRRKKRTKRLILQHRHFVVPMTAKAVGLRMGKGVGKIKQFVNIVKKNDIILEFKPQIGRKTRLKQICKIFKLAEIRTSHKHKILFNYNMFHAFEKTYLKRIKKSSVWKHGFHANAYTD